MSQNNTFNNNQGGSPYGQQPPYGQQSPYGQPTQQPYNQGMAFNPQPQPQQNAYNRAPQNYPSQPAGNNYNNNNNKTPLIIGGIVAGVIIIGLIVALIFVLNKKDDDTSNQTASRTTEATTERVTEARTEAPTEKETEAPTEEKTEAPTEDKTEAKTEEKTEAPTEDKTEAPTEDKTEAPTEDKTEGATEGSTEDASTPAPAPAATVDGLSDDLFSEQISIDGKVYHLPFDYALISNDWTFDMADYGHPEGYLMNPDDKVTSTVRLENPNFDEDLDYYVGFVNASNEAKDIKETSVYSVDFDITWADTTNYPSVVLPKGITWGATIADVKAAYGEPDDTYYSDSLKYWSYTYSDDDYDYSVQLTIYDDRGVTEIDVTSYKND